MLITSHPQIKGSSVIFLYHLLLIVLLTSTSSSFILHPVRLSSLLNSKKKSSKQKTKLSKFYYSQPSFLMSSSNGSSSNINASRMTNKNDNESKATAKNTKIKAPLYITLGPQCCGKTTILNENNIKDICIDDQKGIYYKVPLRYYTDPTEDDIKIMNDTMIMGKSMASRITQNFEEIAFVSKCVVGKASSIEHIWEKELKKLFSLDKDDDTKGKNSSNQSTTNKEEEEKKLYKDFKHAMKKFLEKEYNNNQNKKQELEYDLFAVEGLFCRDGAISQASTQLYEEASKHPFHPIAWGNTNTKSGDYKNALDVAMKTHRPVRFIIHGSISSHEDQSSTAKSPPIKKSKTNSNDTTHFSLPQITRKKLMYRNLERFYHTGRYIPIRALAMSMERSRHILSSASEKTQKIENDFPMMEDEWYLDYALCQLAGYKMDPQRYMSKIENVSTRFRQFPSITKNHSHPKNKNSTYTKPSSSTTAKRQDPMKFTQFPTKTKKNNNFNSDNSNKDASSKTTKM